MDHEHQALSNGRRSVLSVPASDAHKIAKALASAADEVVLDLEDAVAPDSKHRARSVLGEFPWADHAPGPRLSVRVNAPGTPWCHRDIEAVVASAVPADSIVVPKVQTRTDLGFVECLLEGLEAEAGVRARIGVQALVETAAGLENLPEVVSSPDRLESLIIGYADLAASLGRSRDLRPEHWLVTQERVLGCARAARIDAIDGPYLGVADDERFRESVRWTAGLGFDSKWAVHPRQLATINTSFTPSEADVHHAGEVLRLLDEGHAHGRGAVRLDGELVDEAMAVAARRVLAKVGR